MNRLGCYLGCDPEAFFKKDGQIIGAEKVFKTTIPENATKTSSRVVLDGVQFELNVPAQQGVLYLANNIAYCFAHIRTRLKDTDIKVCFDGVVEVSREELDSLSPDSRRLGCAPSLNIYGPKPITVDPETYRKRSAGGHMHFGINRSPGLFMSVGGAGDNRFRLVPPLDIFVGNLGVLFDRDPNAAERRENYGRAGEYRLPTHGLEYRTLSNFWLREYTLMNMMYEFALFAISMVAHSLNTQDIEAELIDIIKIDDVIEAINTNNFGLALVNFRRVKPFIAKHGAKSFGNLVSSLNDIDAFAIEVNKYGLAKFFPEDPTDFWANSYYKGGVNFTSITRFLQTYRG